MPKIKQAKDKYADCVYKFLKKRDSIEANLKNYEGFSNLEEQNDASGVIRDGKTLLDEQE